MKRTLLFVIAALTLACAASCKKPADDPQPTPGPGPGPDPVESGITTTNKAPGGFNDGGIMDWNE